jgi:DNA (cytosine-5)-methyltransferase 1
VRDVEFESQSGASFADEESALNPRVLNQPIQSEGRAGQGSSFTFVDLFAGIGGMRLAFEAAGGECLFTCEWDRLAQKSYLARFPDSSIHGDIRTLDACDVPDHDITVAGFPCQPFSLAGVSKKNSLGKPHGLDCEDQGRLFFDLAQLIDAKRPRAFLLENVDNLLTHDAGRTWAPIEYVLKAELGYDIHAKVFNSRSYVPQKRKRLLIAGFREEVGFDWRHFDLDRAGTTGPVLSSILHPEDGSELDIDGGRYIGPGGKVRSVFTTTPKVWACLERHAANHRAKGHGFGRSVVGPSDVARTLSARYHKDGAEILVGRGANALPRKLTPREAARLMGFPDDFPIVASNTRAWKHFGNSVVVPLIQAAAEAIAPFALKVPK